MIKVMPNTTYVTRVYVTLPLLIDTHTTSSGKSDSPQQEITFPRKQFHFPEKDRTENDNTVLK
jgi:hypothetical protein